MSCDFHVSAHALAGCRTSSCRILGSGGGMPTLDPRWDQATPDVVLAHACNSRAYIGFEGSEK